MKHSNVANPQTKKEATQKEPNNGSRFCPRVPKNGRIAEGKEMENYQINKGMNFEELYSVLEKGKITTKEEYDFYYTELIKSGSTYSPLVRFCEEKAKLLNNKNVSAKGSKTPREAKEIKDKKKTVPKIDLKKAKKLYEALQVQVEYRESEKTIPKHKLSVLKLANLEFHKMNDRRKSQFRTMLESQMNERIKSIENRPKTRNNLFSFTAETPDSPEQNAIKSKETMLKMSAKKSRLKSLLKNSIEYNPSQPFQSKTPRRPKSTFRIPQKPQNPSGLLSSRTMNEDQKRVHQNKERDRGRSSIGENGYKRIIEYIKNRERADDHKMHINVLKRYVQ